MDEALGPCPFCDCEVYQGRGWTRPYCETCGALGPLPRADVNAIAAWNTRSAPAALDAALQRWVEARRVILTMSAADDGFKPAWSELSAAEWGLAAFAKETAPPAPAPDPIARLQDLIARSGPEGFALTGAEMTAVSALGLVAMNKIIPTMRDAWKSGVSASMNSSLEYLDLNVGLLILRKLCADPTLGSAT